MEGIDNSSLIQVHTKFLHDVFGQNEERRDLAIKYFDRVRGDDPNLFVEHLLDVMDAPTTDELAMLIVWILLSKETSPESITNQNDKNLKRILKAGQEELDLGEEEMTHATAKIKQTVDQINKYLKL